MRKNGFTVAEMLIALCMIGVICAIVLPTLRLVTPDHKKAMFKKAYSITEDIVSKMINDDRFYPVEDMGFSYTTAVEVEGQWYSVKSSYHGPDLPKEADMDREAKFKDVFKYYLGSTENVVCNWYAHNGASITKTTNARISRCFMTKDGIIWAIYDTEFCEDCGPAVLTIYPKEKDKDKENEGFYILIHKNGILEIPKPNQAECINNPRLDICKEAEMLKSKGIMKESK